MADGAGFWMDVHQMLLDVSIAPSYIKFGQNGGIQYPLLKIIKKDLGFEQQFSRNHMQLNRGNNTFSEVAIQTNTHATDWSWGVLLQDFDSDGKEDIFISNGILKRPNDLDYINY